ncbi:MAG TPA: TonB-dependent receptor [Candidatus Sulfotelmatobacter sp.]|jgi:vitamin B12 transporter|nr:TonB-dependent receptor [Candidatus Sulfotelmatobacter sp.]
MKTKFAILSLLAVFLVSAVSSKAAPQSQSNKAILAGTLTDPSGAPVGGVQIIAQLDASSAGQSISATSSNDGSYSLTLPAGRYRLRFSRSSFAAREIAVALAPGESRTLNLRLDLEPLSSSVVVTGQTVPSTVQQTTAPTDVISRETIDERQAASLPELLQFSPGIAIDRTGPFGGTTSVFLNGGNSNFTKVLVDGTPINPPGSAVDFSSLTTENIDKVEIVRGAESAIYGSDAVSGVIQLFTHRGDTRVPAFSVYSEGGNFSSARGGGDLSGIIGKFDYSAAAAYFQTDGQGPNDYFVNRTLSGNFGYSFSDTNQLHLSLRNNTSDAGIPGPTLQGPPDLFQGYGQKVFSSNLRWEFTTGSHWHHQLMGTDSYTRQHSFANQGDTFPFDSLLTFNRAAINPQSSYVSRNFIATAGYQYEVENGGINFISPGHLRRNNQAGYLDFRYAPVSRLTLDFGGRVEANSSFGTRVVPRAGGSYALRYGKGFFGDTRFHAFYGQGIKEPRFDQTFGTDPCVPGNPDLKPEASKGWTTGFDQKLASDRWKVSADYFYTRFYDIISFAPTSAFCGTFFNTDLAIARGVNLASEYRFSKWLFVNGNYTYDNSRVISSPNSSDPSLIPGNHLIRRPVNSGSFGVNVAYARVNWNFIGYFTGVRTDSNFVNSTQINNPGYARFDMAANYNVTRGLFVTARAINLFDKKYQDALGFPALGRYYMFGLRYAFTGRN